MLCVKNLDLCVNASANSWEPEFKQISAIMSERQEFAIAIANTVQLILCLDRTFADIDTADQKILARHHREHFTPIYRFGSDSRRNRG